LKQAEAWLVRNQPAPFREELLRLYFELFSFRRTSSSTTNGSSHWLMADEALGCEFSARSL
jgi:hypothetical protein